MPHLSKSILHMKKNIVLILLVFANVILINLSVKAQYKVYADGNLFIIGGGNRSTELMENLIQTADLRNSDFIAILPMASAQPDSTFLQMKSEFNNLCANQVVNFGHFRTYDPMWLDSLGTAKLIYIPGGDQNRFMDSIKNTPVFDAIHRAFKNGSTIAGTSAGAAVMCNYMITGNELKGDSTYHATFGQLIDKNIEFSQGLGLIDSVIIDQHFIKRSRYNRLLSALNAHPNFECIGIDESTALMIHQNVVKVIGDGQVVKISNPVNLSVTNTGLIKFQDIQMSIFTDGDSFYLNPNDFN